MDRVVVFVPTEREAAFFSDYGLRDLHDVRVEICGVGMAECGASVANVLAKRRPELALLAGIAGCAPHGQLGCASESFGLSVGDVVVVKSETVADLVPERFRKTYCATFLPAGFMTVKSNTVNRSGGALVDADVENMEGAAFFAVCERFGVRAMEVRAISNRVGEPVIAENLDTAARKLAAAVRKILDSCA